MGLRPLDRATYLNARLIIISLTRKRKSTFQWPAEIFQAEVSRSPFALFEEAKSATISRGISRFQAHGTEKLAEISLEEAYPGIEFSPGSRGWWAWLKAMPAECVHLDRHADWSVTLLPDVVYLRGKKKLLRNPARPEARLCRDCFGKVMRRELGEYPGNVIAFEPDPEIFSQYFFVDSEDFQAAGLTPELATALETRLARDKPACADCSREATWLWFSRDKVPDLDETGLIAEEPGESYCPVHGAAKFCGSITSLNEANVYYMNFPSGRSGTYVWI